MLYSIIPCSSFRRIINLDYACLQGKLELVTGASVAGMRLEAYSRENELVCALDDDDAMLGSYQIDDGMRIHVRTGNSVLLVRLLTYWFDKVAICKQGWKGRVKFITWLITYRILTSNVIRNSLNDVLILSLQ